MYSPEFQKQVLSLRRLEAEVKSLKHDWLMADEVCDEKQNKIWELTGLAKEVVKHELEWDDNLAIAISNLKEYLDNQTVKKIRADLILNNKPQSYFQTGHKDERNLSKHYFINNQPNNRKKQ
jgi:hypothetical protein